MVAKARVIPELDFHPLADVFPALPQSEYEKLMADIETNGLLQPLVLHEGRVLDGRHRYLACKELGILPKTEALPAKIDAASYVASTNLLRRHLTASQRAIVAAKLEDYQHGGSRLRQAEGQHSLAGLAGAGDGVATTRAKAASQMEVSERSVASARKVLDRCTPEIIAEVETGAINVADAEKVADLPAEQQNSALDIYQHSGRNLPTLAKAARAAKIETAKEEAVEIAKTFSNTDRCHIYRKDIAELAGEIAAGSIDIIITDPPYEDDGISLYSQLADLAAHCLRPGGYLLVMTGCTSVPDWAKQLEHPRLSFNYLCHIGLEGANQRVFHRRVYQRHKLLWWYVAEQHIDDGSLRQSSFSSPLTDTAKAQQSYHRWGQQVGLMRQIVAEFCQPSDLVLDPFCGGGTTGLAALAHGCRFIGTDIDAEAVAISKGRAAELLAEMEGDGDTND